MLNISMRKEGERAILPFPLPLVLFLNDRLIRVKPKESNQEWAFFYNRPPKLFVFFVCSL